MKGNELFTGERFVPGIDDVKLEIEHLQRYLSVASLMKDKEVLDAACGEGYGSNILAENAKSVIGIDIDEGAVSRAVSKYAARKNLRYMQGSIEQIDLPDDSVDVVVSFETIEHVNEDIQKKFLEEISRVLRPDGFLIMSTPNKDVYSDRHHYKNDFHVKEFYYDEFVQFLKTKFDFVEVYNQAFQVVSVINRCDNTETEVKCYRRDGSYYTDGKYYIAVASQAERQSNGLSSVFVKDDNEYEALIDRVITLQEEEEVRNRHISLLDGEIRKNRECIERQRQCLEEQRQYIEQVESSHAYKLAKKFQKIEDFLLPKNSRRRFFARILVNLFRHPKLMLHVLNFKRVKNYIKYMKLEGMEGVQKRYEEAVAIERMQNISEWSTELDLEPILKEKKSIEKYEKIVLPICDAPLVSIIIPVYNEFQYTYNCLKSIAKHSGHVAYEVIVADDCSTDLTTDILKAVENVRVVRTETNLRFLLNCNHAAEEARGKYILFLNNDTQVQKNWLEPLISLIESDDTIGMVGSKLVYPDGHLQEAGGIVWQDASAWNYGNQNNPENPEYNYVKEVDYISGAAIMIKASLWKEIGGFDERFAPAYCEDSDLAFEVRRHGYKVIYQPLSMVVHFEGVSNGTDTNEGQKSYQQVNQKKFLDKWQAILSEEHFPNAENVFVARDRSAKKPVLLMIDHYVPMFDKDAGSRTLYQYLKMFVSHGYSVKLLGDNFYKHEPYTSAFQQMGIEVLYGAYYANNWKEWLRENGQKISYVWLNRPHISIKYIDEIRKYTNAKVMYYGMDLHFWRVQREYEVSKDKALLAEAEKWKEKEFYLMRNADMNYTISYVEKDLIKQMDSSIPIKVMGIFAYENFRTDVPAFIQAKRRDLIFVGGFTHEPNLDAVKWFVNDIFPFVLKKIDVKLHIVGSNPPDEILQMGNENIIVEGFVSDEKLEYLYDTCKMAVIPLRFGAGVKGKVIEAMYNGLPVITTSIGVEGIENGEKYLIVEDEAEKFASQIVSLYQDENKLADMSTAGLKYVKEYFGLESTWKKIEGDFTGGKFE